MSLITLKPGECIYLCRDSDHFANSWDGDMDELSIIFSSRPATEVFYVASIIFILAYPAGFLFVLGRSRAPGRRAVIRTGFRRLLPH
jgi:hypothetical protein